MRADIKCMHTIEESNINQFNKNLSTVVSDLQNDGLEVEIQYQFEVTTYKKYYNALIIGRGK